MAPARKRFEGKVAIITGSSTGLGADFAKALAAEGASVSLTGRNIKNLEAVAAECKKLGAKVVYNAGDITSDVLRKKLVDSTLSAFGRIDILINNAGLNLGIFSILEPNYEAFDTIHDVNLRSVYQLSGLVAKELVKTKGNIINISSAVGKRAIAGGSAYCVSKAGLDMLTRCIAAELAPEGVRVNGVNPGVFRSEFHRFLTTDQEKIDDMFENMFSKLHPLGRIGEPVELTNLVLFLASDAASFMTGTNVSCDGGFLLNANMEFPKTGN